MDLSGFGDKCPPTILSSIYAGIKKKLSGCDQSKQAIEQTLVLLNT